MGLKSRLALRWRGATLGQPPSTRHRLMRTFMSGDVLQQLDNCWYSDHTIGVLVNEGI